MSLRLWPRRHLFCFRLSSPNGSWPIYRRDVKIEGGSRRERNDRFELVGATTRGNCGATTKRLSIILHPKHCRAFRGQRATEPAAVENTEWKVTARLAHFPLLASLRSDGARARRRVLRSEQVESLVTALGQSRADGTTAPAEIIEQLSWRSSGEDHRKVAAYKGGKREKKDIPPTSSWLPRNRDRDCRRVNPGRSFPHARNVQQLDRSSRASSLTDPGTFDRNALVR